MVRKRKEFSAETFISHYASERPVNWARRFGVEQPLHLEIGCGLGEFLVRCAREQPRVHFVGLELEWKRVKKTLRKITVLRQASGDVSLGRNVRVLQVDATVALERLFSPGSLQRVFCLFPCPWPKDSHEKHRLFSRAFLRLLNSRLTDDGEALIVTDFEPYEQWIREQLSETGLVADFQKVAPRFDTKFERKWCEQGQREFFEIRLKKKDHVSIPLAEDESLRVYHVKDLDPDNVVFEDLTGETSVILKEYLYDASRQKGMFHFVVAEPSITQHLWAAVSRQKNGWYIAKAEGQTALPTKGVAMALHRLYQAALRSVPTETGLQQT